MYPDTAYDRVQLAGFIDVGVINPPRFEPESESEFDGIPAFWRVGIQRDISEGMLWVRY
jgi:hypothetical protein